MVQNMAERTIFWVSLSEDETDERFVGDSLDELAAVIHANPLHLNLDVRPLPVDLRTPIVEQLSYGHLDMCIAIIRRLRLNAASGTSFGVLAYCPPDHPAARAAQRRLLRAAWGISLSGVLSLAYSKGNEYLLWHEALHLLGAQDHYDTTTLRPTCDLRNCVMQYAPTSESIGSGPVLCERTMAILRNSVPNLALDDPRNANVIRNLSKGNPKHLPPCASPTAVEDPYTSLGSHPEIVERLWDVLAPSLPKDTRCILFGTPALVAPRSGVVLAVAFGTVYCIRLPSKNVRLAIAAGARTVMRFTGAGEIDMQELFGPDWVFGWCLKDETQWCRSVYDAAETTQG
jgi:hypothetical protein